MKITIKSLLVAGVIAACALGAPAFAQDAPVPDHPRVNEVDSRLQHQQQRIDAGTAQGQITQGQAARDEKRDARIAGQASRDEAAHGGHLTKREQRRLNKELNHNSGHIAHQRRAAKKEAAQ